MTEQEKEFYKHMPRKGTSSAALFFNEEGKILLVKPTYKEGWEIPGGLIEGDESPLFALKREVMEEIALPVGETELLCVHYLHNTDATGDWLHFIFDGGVLAKEEIEAIRLPVRELSEYGFYTIPKAMEMLRSDLGLRVSRAALARREKRVIYLES